MGIEVELQKWHRALAVVGLSCVSPLQCEQQTALYLHVAKSTLMGIRCMHSTGMICHLKLSLATLSIINHSLHPLSITLP